MRRGTRVSRWFLIPSGREAFRPFWATGHLGRGTGIVFSAQGLSRDCPKNAWTIPWVILGRIPEGESAIPDCSRIQNQRELRPLDLRQ
jgi:hypothetical protein